MIFEIDTIWSQASSLRGCLSHLKTTTSYRRFDSDEDHLILPDPFVSDEAKLLSSKTFRCLGDKTQVFTLPKNALVRTRKSHVMEVAACTVVACELLGLNTNLGRAAAVGHDIGHVPFGHQGEAWMAKAMGIPNFCHEVMAPIIAQKIERAGKGLNLTFHTLDAMMRHSGNTAKDGMSPEAWVLRHTDKFAYIFHDINDIGCRAKYPLPEEIYVLANSFGSNQRERTTTAIAALVVESSEVGHVSFEHSEIAQKFNRLRKLMYEIYPRVTQQNVSATMEPVLEFLDMLNIADPFLLLSLMTDKDVLFLSSLTMKDMNAFNQTAVSEIVPHMSKIGKIDMTDPDLDWYKF